MRQDIDTISFLFHIGHHGLDEVELFGILRLLKTDTVESIDLNSQAAVIGFAFVQFTVQSGDLGEKFLIFSRS